MPGSRFQIVSSTLTDGEFVILIEDLNGRKSITNDAEDVVKTMIKWRHDHLPSTPKPFRIHYIDSDGRRDELLHDGTKFINFKAVDS